MTAEFETTSLWLRTLAPQENDPFEAYRSMLRNAYLQLRAVVEPLAAEIALSMPEFTVHSIAHCDALWKMGSMLTGDAFPINPAEAFVLGGSFLLHDLGMGLSAYESAAEVKGEPLYLDLVEQGVKKFVDRTNAEPTATQRAEIEASALANVLRRRHASQAEKLISRRFKTSGGQPFYLIENTELRLAFGPTIGAIAHSHWYDVNSLPDHFPTVQGSPGRFPIDWQVDPLKLACVLRLADASHVDSERAPTYLNAFRRATGTSADHWYFQERYAQPRLEGDRLVYTSSEQFGPDSARAWWLGFETVQSVDAELRRVHALCSDLNRPLFAARGVAGAESPERFALLVPVADWIPADARLKVSSVEDLAQKLGGKALYGDRPRVALRELIANAVDATSARVKQYNLVTDTGIYVTLEKLGNDYWLEVEDHGLGMSQERMLSALTDFGSSNWTSDDVLNDYPGLIARGYKSIGRFGVGFYSVFMLSDHVEVRSLKYREGSSKTSVLIFDQGVSSRPLLRGPSEREEIVTGGTIVRLKLRENPLSEKGLFQTEVVDGSVGGMLRRLLTSLCSLLEFDLYAKGPEEGEFQRVINGGEWKVMTPFDLFGTVYAEELSPNSSSSLDWAQVQTAFADAASDLKDKSGDVIGRATLGLVKDLDGLPWWISPRARVFVGGLEAGHIWGMFGAFVGEPYKADRLRGFPVASTEELGSWAVQQAIDAAKQEARPEPRVIQALSLARSLGAVLDDRPFAFTSEGAISPKDLAEWLEDKDDVVMIPTWELASFIDASGKQVLRDRLHGDVVELPSNALYVDIWGEWIFPDEILEYPKDNRFSDYGEVVADVFNSRRWWNQVGGLGAPQILMRALEDVWSADPIALADGTRALLQSGPKDDRLLLTTALGNEIRVDGYQVRRPI